MKDFELEIENIEDVSDINKNFKEFKIAYTIYYPKGNEDEKEGIEKYKIQDYKIKIHEKTYQEFINSKGKDCNEKLLNFINEQIIIYLFNGEKEIRLYKFKEFVTNPKIRTMNLKITKNNETKKISIKYLYEINLINENLTDINIRKI